MSNNIERCKPLTPNLIIKIVLKNGKIINVNADRTEWFNESRTLFLYNGEITVGTFNIDNIVGFIRADYTEEREYKK